MASHTTVLLSLAALVCLAALTLAAPQRFDDNDAIVNLFRERRATQGRMRGYAGINMRRGYPMAFAGGFAASHNSPAFAAPAMSAEEEEEAPEAQPEPQPIEASDEEEQQDEEEQPPAPVVKPVRPSRARPARPAAAKPTRPQKPQVEEEEEDDAPAPPKRGNKQRGGATAIATSYSNGKGASSNSHAIAYDGNFSGGQFRHRYQ